jgi:capsular exopolysaccharide synthesis family protein
MSQEIQLINTNLPLQPAIASQPQVLAPAGLPEPTPFRRLHQLLRGRYLLAAVLATIGAAAGATAGFLLPKPSYESVAIVKIDPMLNRPGPDNGLLPLFQSYTANMMVELKSEPVVREAMQCAAWRQVRPYTGDAPPADQVTQFVSNLTVKPVPFTPEMIQVIYDDGHKDGKDVAQIAVRSVLGAFKTHWTDTEADLVKAKIAWNSQQKDSIERQIASNKKVIAEFNKQIGGDAAAQLKAHDESMIAIKKELNEANKLKEDAEFDIARRSKGQGVLQPYTSEEIARVSLDFTHLLNQKADALNSYQMSLFTLGSKHPETIAAQQRLAQWQQMITDYITHFNENFFIEERSDGAPGRPIQKNLDKLNSVAKTLEAEYDRENTEIKRLVGLQYQIQQAQDQNEGLKLKVADYSNKLEIFEFEQSMGGRYTVVDSGSTPVQGGDRRPVFAALGLLGGAALPVGFLLLIGLANPRYRFSDETGREMNGLNLLGILPDLPDRLSDPEQASIAAHCVHQIRTMLQISGAPEERRVFAVTSAAPGDGKTSLTLALGLSYAACGARTLLIDCDLVGAGLTSRMNVSSPAGVLEAIANRSLFEYVRTTDVADVTILPVGSAQTLHASTLSPAALRRLIDEARKQYDTILIDTGPILGSIEAALVCAAADAVVLTVARGQQRPLVERAISRLMGIGAKLAGVVFNRAQSGDFDRSISGASSLRSAAAGSGHNGNGNGSGSARFGTLGRAVHSHYNRQADINEG